MKIWQIGGSLIQELKFLDRFSVMARTPICPSERYSAANDTPVTVFERVKVRVKMPLYEGDFYLGMVPVMVTGVVADVGHNILSTEHMVAAGWEVKFSKAEIFHYAGRKEDWLVMDSPGVDVPGFTLKVEKNRPRKCLWKDSG